MIIDTDTPRSVAYLAALLKNAEGVLLIVFEPIPQFASPSVNTTTFAPRVFEARPRPTASAGPRAVAPRTCAVGVRYISLTFLWLHASEHHYLRARALRAATFAISRS